MWAIGAIDGLDAVLQVLSDDFSQALHYRGIFEGLKNHQHPSTEKKKKNMRIAHWQFG